MNDDDLNRAFSSTPSPDENAKKRALNLAMAEFQAVQREQTADKNAREEKKNNFFQGFLNWWRPMGDNNPNRNTNMPLSQKKLIISGMATSGLVVFGALFFGQFPLQQNNHPDVQMPNARQLADVAAPGINEEVIVTGVRSASEKDLRRQESGAVEPIRLEFIDKPSPQAAESRQQIAKVSLQQQKKEFDKFSTYNTAQEAEAGLAMPAPQPSVSYAADTNTVHAPEYRDRFEEFVENSVVAVAANPVSTFSIDVDTASYSFVRRTLNSGRLPPKDAVRVEEMINYFDYNYSVPATKSAPFAANVAVMESPWKTGNKLVHVGIKGYQLSPADIPRSNLVFLLDVSGSMSSPDKLPLVQQSMEILLDNLKPTDTVAIVIYAGAAGTVLEPTPVKEKQKILSAIQQLQAGGSTAGAQGIQLAYQLAEATFDPKAVNRIILATDGDFNVGPTGDNDLETFVQRKRDKGIYLSILGFGQGNYQDAMMQTLAQNGNGVAAYIDTLSEAQKVLVHEATSTLFPIANDVKIQMEFNPATVAEYRLIGYETRALNREDFANDKVDAGDIGAGHTVTAIYEITPAGGATLLEPSRYQAGEKSASRAKASDEYGFLRIRYKLPGEKVSKLIEQPISKENFITMDQRIEPDSLQLEAGFATAVAGFAQLLRGSKFIGDYSYDDVLELAQKTKGADNFGYRNEFIQLVRKAKIAKEL
jgi:Ca-activated chloride channel family protein